MTTPTVEVTVTLAAQDGTPYEGVTVRARLDGNEIYEGVVVSDDTEAVTDEDGVAVLDCFPNAPTPTGLGSQGSTYRFWASIPTGRTVNYYALVPNSACRLEDILLPSDATPLTDAQIAVLQVQAYVGNAQGSADAAAASASSAASLLDQFDDRYLGAKAADPSTDNDGNALATGALYFNTTSSQMKVWGGASWAVANIITSAFGASLVIAATAAAARSTLGASATGEALFTAASAAGARGTLGSTVTGDALFTAATAAAARGTLGLATSSTDNAIPRFDGATGSTQGSSATISDTGAITIVGGLTQSESAAREWAVRTRSTVTTFPVPSIRPGAQSVIALDVMPNGTPSESAGNGYAWLDVCSADIQDNDNAVHGARLAATSTLARVASFNYNGATAKPLAFGIGSADKWYIDATAFQFAPAADNTYALGSGGQRCSEIFAGNGTINTSDRREKQDIEPITDAVLDAWAEVEFCTYRWKAAVAQKGDAARTHVGLIAQDILEAFARHGLDAHRYGLLCFDEWQERYEPGEFGEMVPVQEAGNRYGVRAEQCLFLEAALMRREIKRLKA